MVAIFQSRIAVARKHTYNKITRMYPIRFGTKSATCTIFAASRVGVGWLQVLLVQQLVLAAAAAVRKDQMRCCKVGLSQRSNDSPFLLTRDGARTVRCKLRCALPWPSPPSTPHHGRRTGTPSRRTSPRILWPRIAEGGSRSGERPQISAE